MRRSRPAAEPAPSDESAPLDLRLAPVLASAWAGAWFLVAAPGPVVVAVGAAAAALAAVVLVPSSLRSAALRSPQRAPGAGGTVRGTTAAGAIVLALVATSVLATAEVARAGPVPALVERGATARLTVVVTGQPHRAAPPDTSWAAAAPPRWVVGARVVAVEDAGRGAGAARTPVVLIGGPAWSTLERGATVSALGRLEPTGAADPARALVLTRGPPRTVSPPRGWSGVVAHLRAGLRAACVPLGPDAGALLPGLVVGDTSALTPSLQEAVRTTGLTHLTAVSGANVALVLAAATALAGFAGLRRRARVVVAGAVLLAFAALAGPDPSVMRAALTGVIGLAGVLAARRGAGLPALAAAGCVLLVVDPWLARSFGFVLSVLATGALLLLARPWARALGRWMPRPLAVALAVPLAAQAVCGPVILLLADGLPVLSVLANVLVAPVVGPSTVVGLAATLVAPLWPAGASALARVAGLGTGWIALVARALASAPVATLPWPGGLHGAAALAAATALLLTAPPLLASAARRGASAGPGRLAPWRPVHPRPAPDPPARPPAVPAPPPAPGVRRVPVRWRGSTPSRHRWSSSRAPRPSSRSAR